MVNLTDKLPSEGDHGEKHQLLLVVQTRKCPKVRENHMKEQGPNNLYPEDLIPFTRYPVFLVIDSKNSHAFKAIHNEEKGEPSALLLSPRAMPGADSMGNISQSTYFLTASMQAFCQLAWIIYDIDIDTYAHAENIVFSAMEQYEEALCTFVRLKNVWGQPNPFLRRLNLRRRASFPGAAPSPN